MEDQAKNEILEAIGEFSNKVDEKFAAIDGKFAAIDTRLTRIEATMVTKEYLDDKLLNLRGDMVVMMRKEDEKVKTLVQILQRKKLLDEAEAKSIFALEPFPNR